MSRRMVLLATLLAAAGAAAQAGAAAPAMLPPPPIEILPADDDGALDRTADATQPPAPESAPLTDGDDRFIDAALAAGQKAVAASALARSRAADEEIRELAAALESDHRSTNDQLVELRAGTDSPTSTIDAAVGDPDIADLEALPSAEFDAEWLLWQAAAHANALALFARTADGATHSEAVRRFAIDTLPTLQAHADRIAALRSARAAQVADDIAD